MTPSDKPTTSPAVELVNLHYAYPQTAPNQPSPWVLRGAELRVDHGELLALMGPTGAGKTTLALALLGIVPQSTGGRIRGRVSVLGMDSRTTPVPVMARRVGLVLQDPDSQFLMTNVEDKVAFGLALRQVGLAGFESRSPAELSGGQKQRVALAAILAMQPELLVLDEPTARLDSAGADQLYAALEQLRQAAAATTAVVISNDNQWVAAHADRVAVLFEGTIVETGPPDEVLADPDRLADWGLTQPPRRQLASRLRSGGLPASFDSLDSALAQLDTWFSSADHRP